MLLREKDRNTLLQILSTATVPIEVWVYGSRINGTAHEGSDLDLVVRSSDLKRLPAGVVASLCEKLRNSNIPILIDLKDWATLPDSFHRNIEQQHEVIFSKIHPTCHEILPLDKAHQDT